MALNLKPLGSRVVVEPLEQEDVTASGIVLPETAKEKPQRGKVLSIGPGDRDESGKRIQMDVAAGDTVLFAKYAGTEIKLDGKKLLIRKGGHGGLFLPQVPVEQGWDRDEYLSTLCWMKAGLPADAWRKPGVQLYCFEAEIFEE